ncbi:MAG TPA: tetratricopeptide repeat protein, partial [Micromonosporaceae bacterium]
VTSRNQLTALVATHNARPLPLDLLTPEDAVALLTRRIGADRVTAEPEAVNEIISRCAHLPLALAIVAARAATRPTFPLRALADELHHARGRLKPFTGADLATDMPTVFSWSYEQLSTGAARLFRLLGLHPGSDLAVPAAASLAGTPASEVRSLLDEMAQSHLIVERSPGRYTLHDLLLAYAGELVHAVDAEPDRRAAVHRMLDHYLQAAYAGCLLLYPHRNSIEAPAVVPGVTPVDLSDHEQALAWFVREHPTLLAAIRLAADAGFDAHTWRLAWSLHTYLDRRGEPEQEAFAQMLGLQAARRLGDPVGQAQCHHLLASAHTFAHRYGEAHEHYQRAIGLFGEAGDNIGRAHSYLNRALTFEHEERYDEALDQAQQSLDLFRAEDHRSGQAKALNAVGWYQAVLGRLAPAQANCRQALDLLEELDDRYGQALTWDSLGYVHHLLGDFAQARSSYQRSIDLWRQLSDHHSEAAVWRRLGESRLAAGDLHGAESAWRRALAMLEDIAPADAEDLRHRLSTLGETPSGSSGGRSRHPDIPPLYVR